MTQLVEAVKSGNLRGVVWLLDKGADPNEKSAIGWAPLNMAVRYGRAEIAGILIDRGAAMVDFWDDALHMQGGNKKAIEVLISKGANLNEKDRSGYTPLMLAVINGRKDAIRLLLEAGADTEIVSRQMTGDYGTAEYLAAELFGRDDLAAVFIEHRERKEAERRSAEQKKREEKEKKERERQETLTRHKDALNRNKPPSNPLKKNRQGPS